MAIRTDRFGEFILTLPAIYALKETFPRSRLTLMAHPYSMQLVTNSNIIDEAIGYEDRLFAGIPPTLRLIREIKKRKFDLAVVFNPKKKFHLITFLARIPVRVGYDRKWSFLLNKKIKDLKSFGIKHEIEYNFDLIKAIGVNSDKKLPSIYIDNKEEGRALGILAEHGISKESGFAVIHPWTSDPIKQWPISNFIELAKEITNQLDLKIVIIGGRDESERGESLFGNISSDVINLTGKASLKESASLLKYSKLLISGDSGPVHLACAVGTPVIALFRNDIPGKSAKRWGPRGEGHIVIEKNTLSDICVMDVFEKAKELLNRNSTA